MARTTIPYSGYGSQGLQVFTPVRIETISAGGSLDTTNVVCIRVFEATDYQINGTGDTTTMPAGCTGIAQGTTTLKFTAGAVVEVM